MLRKIGDLRMTLVYAKRLNERICSGKASSRSWSEKKWTGMLRKNPLFVPYFWEWTGLLRNNSEFLSILSIFIVLLWTNGHQKEPIFALLTADCSPGMLNGYAPEYVIRTKPWTSILSGFYTFWVLFGSSQFSTYFCSVFLPWRICGAFILSYRERSWQGFTSGYNEGQIWSW